ncbi:MAG: energy transducer TonB [Proteobacteria bacterium]|nr:energy transducer TonB [Pseudomonadota bacterium]
MAAHLEDTSGFFTRRGVVVGGILLLHVFIAWALATGLVNHAIEALAPPIQAVIETESHKDAPPPPPPPPTFERPPVEIPPTDTIVEIPQAAPATAITNVTTQHVAAPVAAKPTNHRNAGFDSKHGMPDPENYYPPSSRRNNEEGVAQVHVCINAQGKLAQDPTVEKGTGFSALDAAAITYAKAIKFTPASDDGKPLDNGCFSFNVRFKLHS